MVETTMCSRHINRARYQAQPYDLALVLSDFSETHCLDPRGRERSSGNIAKLLSPEQPDGFLSGSPAAELTNTKDLPCNAPCAFRADSLHRDISTLTTGRLPI